jgi:hypothetical protein
MCEGVKKNNTLINFSNKSSAHKLNINEINIYKEVRINQRFMRSIFTEKGYKSLSVSVNQ